MVLKVILFGNSGYSDMITNTYKSIRKTHPHVVPEIYMLDTPGLKLMATKNIKATPFLENNANTGAASFRDSQWKNIVTVKPKIILQNLLKNNDVLYCDSDIVWKKRGIIWYINSALKKNNKTWAIQHEYNGKPSKNACSGFIYLKPTQSNINMVRKWISACERHRGDQNALNEIIRKNTSFRNNVLFLPKEQFPNGYMWQKHREKTWPFLVHYNYITGKDNKINSMKRDGNWTE